MTAYDPRAYNEWADAQLFPGETPDIALDRQVRAHKGAMKRGLRTGYDEETGKAIYSPPIAVGDCPDCPFHGEGCSAWIALQEGYDTEIMPDGRAQMLAERKEKAVRRGKKTTSKRKTLKFSVNPDGFGGGAAAAKTGGHRSAAKVSETKAMQDAKRAFSAEVPDEIIFEDGEEEEDE